ncbi:MAG: TatD family hydrolase [Verrucomicrobiota bacterium JB022]|nr:TatD family hydrolase [Verrucomicrobiota bacterium JB022]
MRQFDAHLHLQDTRLDPHRERLIAALREADVAGLVTNGTSPADWPAVEALAEAHPGWIRPAYGLHPWRVGQEPAGWLEELRQRLQDNSDATVGEVGLDQWIPGHDLARQRRAFEQQLDLACELGRTVTIHCLKAWGPLLETLQRRSALPPRMLLHSPGASPEMIHQLAEMGCYFSVSGYFCAPHRTKYRQALQAFPLDRLLIETDAPDMLGPEHCQVEELRDLDQALLNSPRNLPMIYQCVADAKGIAMEELGESAERLFYTLFARS